MNDYSLSSIKTLEERKRLYSEISLVLDVLFRQQADLEKILDTKVSPQLRTYILSLLQGKPLDEALREKIAKTLAEIKNKAEGLQAITLTLAFEAQQSTIDKISSFARQTLGENIIIEINVEPNILGGAIIVFNGLYHDYSLKTKLEEVFKTKREELFKSI